MTLSTALIWRLPPRIPEFFPTPTMVVLAGTLALMALSWLSADASRRFSCSPLTGVS